MNRDDLVKLVGAKTGAEDQPVAFLLANGYACAGYYHAAVNEGLAGTCVLLNARLIALANESQATGRPSIVDFNEFLEEIVARYCESSEEALSPEEDELYGRSIPLMAIPFDQIAVVYPVAHIGALMRRAERQDHRLPSFLDFKRSEIIGLLTTKLW